MTEPLTTRNDVTRIKLLVALEEHGLAMTQFNIRSPPLDDVFLTFDSEAPDIHKKELAVSDTVHINEEETHEYS